MNVPTLVCTNGNKKGRNYVIISCAQLKSSVRAESSVGHVCRRPGSPWHHYQTCHCSVVVEVAVLCSKLLLYIVMGRGEWNMQSERAYKLEIWELYALKHHGKLSHPPLNTALSSHHQGGMVRSEGEGDGEKSPIWKRVKRKQSFMKSLFKPFYLYGSLLCDILLYLNVLITCCQAWLES